MPLSSSPSPRTSPRDVSWAHAALRLALLAAVVAGALLVARALGFFALGDPAALALAVRHARRVHGIAPLFVAAYAVLSALGVPATPLTLAGGAVFGTLAGSLLIWLGAMLGAAGGYWLARLVGGGVLRALLERVSGRALRALHGERGAWAMFRLRLVPVVPFSALNFGAGLAHLPFVPYMVATALGILPATVVYSYFADSLLAGAAGARRHAWLNILIASALLLAISYLPSLVRRKRPS